MEDSYDPEHILAKILAWRAAAKLADPVTGKLYLSLAHKAMQRLNRSLNIPALRNQKFG